MAYRTTFQTNSLLNENLEFLNFPQILMSAVKGRPFLRNSKTGWPDWANCRPLWGLVTLGSFLDLIISPNRNGYFFRWYTLIINLTKNGLGSISGDFLINSSGVDVMITIFGDFWKYSAKTWHGIFLENQCFEQKTPIFADFSAKIIFF
jgi:hypothetical protein